MTPEELDRTQERELADDGKYEHHVHVCVGTACEALGSATIAKNLEAEYLPHKGKIIAAVRSARPAR